MLCGRGARLIGSDPTDIRNVDHLFVRAEAFDLVIRLRPRRIGAMNFRSVRQRFTAEAVDSGDGGFDVIHLEAEVIDAEPLRLTVFAGLEFQDRNIEMAVGEINPVLPHADLFQAKGLFIERRGFFDVFGPDGNGFDLGHGPNLRRPTQSGSKRSSRSNRSSRLEQERRASPPTHFLFQIAVISPAAATSKKVCSINFKAMSCNSRFREPTQSFRMTTSYPRLRALRAVPSTPPSVATPVMRMVLTPLLRSTRSKSVPTKASGRRF